METNSKTQRSPRRIFIHILLIVAGIAMLYPLLWMLASSFKPEHEIFSAPGLWPTTWTLSNYADGWNGLGIPFSRFFRNSIVVVIGAIVGNLISCSLAAYVFARLNFRFKRLWFSIMLLTIMVPWHVIIVPQYIMFGRLGWVDTYYPLIIPKLLATDGFFIFLMVQFIRGIPRELDEAAELDGCTHFGTYWRIILPLMVPALATTAIFTFIWTWNDFFAPLIYLTSPEDFTVPLALRAFMDSTGESAWGSLFSMSILSLAPVFVFFIVAQKYLIRGIATTGIK